MGSQRHPVPQVVQLGGTMLTEIFGCSCAAVLELAIITRLGDGPCTPETGDGCTHVR